MADRWIVMTSCAKMPHTCWGRYRNVALVKLTRDYAERQKRPKMISAHARGVLRVVHLGPQNVGQTSRGAYQRELAYAQERADEMNA